MIIDGFHIEGADFVRDGELLRAIRQQVFIEEQGVPAEIEQDARDAHCRHVLARAKDGTPIGTGRIDPEGKIGRMAVLPDWRDRGVGAALLQALLDLARSLGHHRAWLDAQASAVRFYTRHGFSPVGERFTVAGIEHQRMERELPPAEPVPRPAPPPIPEPARYQTTTRDEVLAASLELAADARRELWIYTRDFEPAVYGDPAMLDALRSVATRGRGAALHLLVQEPEQALRDGHPLIALAQRLASSILIRAPVEEADRQYPSAFLLNDRGGYLLRALGSRFDGVGNRHDAGRQRQLRDYFRQVWERSEYPGVLRELHL